MKTLRYFAAALLLICSIGFAQTSTPRTFTTFTSGGWSSTNPYHFGDEVYVGNILYISTVVGSNTGNNPTTDAGAHWLALTAPAVTLPASVSVAATNAQGAVIQATTPAIAALVSGNNGLRIFGDSIACYTGASSIKTSFAWLLHLMVGGQYQPECRSGDQAEDQNWERIFASSNPRGAGLDPLYLEETGTNDVTVYNTNANQQIIFKRTKLANLSWLGLPASSKVTAYAATHNGSWSNVGPQVNVAMASSTNGNTLAFSFTTTTANQPFYLWYPILDGSSGTFTVSLNGTLQTDPSASGTTFYSKGDGGATIATQNGVAATIAGVRLVAPTAGSNTLVVTVTSSTGNLVGIAGVGVSPVTPSSLNPRVVAVSVNDRSGSYASTESLVPTYNGFTQAIVSQLAGDGINVLYADTRTAVGSNNSATVDGLHPNDASHTIMANTIAGVLPAALLSQNEVQGNVSNAENLSLDDAISPEEFWSPNPLNIFNHGWGRGVAWYKGNGQTASTGWLPNTGITTLFSNTGGTPMYCIGAYNNSVYTGNATGFNSPPYSIPTPANCYVKITGNGAIDFPAGQFNVSSGINSVGSNQIGHGIRSGDAVDIRLTDVTTSASSSDLVGGIYVFASTTCHAVATNATAAAMLYTSPGIYLSYAGNYSMTFYHPATAGATFSIYCSAAVNNN